ncbi:MAG: MlaD family protein, partial [Caulobacteraceae bacterium]
VEVLDRVNRLFSDENIKTLGATMSDVQAVTAELRDRKSIIAAVQKTMQNAAEAAQQIRDLAKSSQSLVNGDGKRTMAKLGDAADQIEGAAKGLHVMVDKLQGPTTDFAANGLPRLSGAITSLQRTLDQLGQVIGEVQANPRGLVGKAPAKQIEVKP